MEGIKQGNEGTTEDLTQVLEVINAKGDTGELKKIAEGSESKEIKKKLQ